MSAPFPRTPSGFRRHAPAARIALAAAALAALIAEPVPAGTAEDLESATRLFEARKYAEARQILEPLAARAAPAEIAGSAALCLGRIAMAELDLEKATAWFEKAAALKPADSISQLWLGRSYGQQAMKAGIFRQPGLAGKTRTAFEKAVELDPNNLEARSALVEYYLRAPGFLGGGEEKARAQAEEIARRDPVLGHRSRALIHREGGRDDEAEKEYQAALALDPNRADPYYWLGFLHQEKKRYDRALDVFETMLARDVDTAGALYQIGKTGALSGLKLDRAEECLRKYLETEPKAGAPPHAWAHYRLGMVHEKKGARDLARQSYEAALRLDPKLEDARKALKALR